jgi:hypothetical protein
LNSDGILGQVQPVLEAFSEESLLKEGIPKDVLVRIDNTLLKVTKFLNDYWLPEDGTDGTEYSMNYDLIAFLFFKWYGENECQQILNADPANKVKPAVFVAVNIYDHAGNAIAVLDVEPFAYYYWFPYPHFLVQETALILNKKTYNRNYSASWSNDKKWLAEWWENRKSILLSEGIPNPRLDDWDFPNGIKGFITRPCYILAADVLFKSKWGDRDEQMRVTDLFIT